MKCIAREKLQLGQTGWILGDLPNLLAGALDAEIFTCSQCGKIEFYLPENSENDVPQVQCPECGNKHDFDYPRCPICKYDYK